MAAVVTTERSRHCQRVAHLCWRVATHVRLPDAVKRALLVAASEHEGGPAANRDLVGVGAADKTTAALILRCWRGFPDADCGDAVRLAARVLETCDDFDDSVEFSAFECLPVAGAIGSFYADAALYDKRVVGALRAIVSPREPLRTEGRLPVLPSAVSKLMRTSAESATAVGLESIASSDPVLAGRLVGTANSAYFGSRSTITSLRDAILRVGVPFARKVLISACLGKLFASSTLKDLWKHSTVVASAAYEMAAASGHDPELAYIAGLVHDIGRLVMHSAAPAERISEDTFVKAGFPLVYAENLVYGTDHALAGSALLESWDLPQEIVDAVRDHHSPERSSSNLAGVLLLAEEYSREATAAPEMLSREMRMMSACRISGSETPAGHKPDRSAAIFALAA